VANRRNALALVVSASIASGCLLLTSIPDITSNANADGGTDAASTDGSAPFCDAQTTPALFCDDFDDRTDLLARWDSTEPGGLTQIDGREFLSAPHALLAGPPPQGDCRYAVVRKAWGPSYRASRLGFSVHLDAPHPSPVPAVTMQSVTLPNATCQLLFTPDPTSPMILEQVLTPPDHVANSNHALPNLQDGVWHDVTLDYDPDGKIVVTLDGKTILADPASQTCPQGRGPLTVEMGWHCVTNTPPDLSVHIDNVTFDPR
jgi:hypothetical protein